MYHVICLILLFTRVLTHFNGQQYDMEKLSDRFVRGSTSELPINKAEISFRMLNNLQNEKFQRPTEKQVIHPHSHQSNLQRSHKPRGQTNREHSMKEGKAHPPSHGGKDSPFIESLHNTIPISTDNSNSGGLELMQSFIRNNVTFVVFIQRGYSMGQFEYIVELASKFNPVIVISDLALASNTAYVKKKRSDNNTTVNFQLSQPVFTVQFSQVEMNSSLLFDEIYRPINLHGDSPVRREYEKLCIQRWIYVSNLCTIFNISHVFYADSDVAIFSNLTTAFRERNKYRKCDAEISVCGLLNDNPLATVSGHSSFWSATALSDLSTFITQLFSKPYVSSLYHPARPGGNRVTDMTVLFTYWIAHHLNDSYIDAGMPQYLYQTWSHENKPKEQWLSMLMKQRQHFNSKIDFARNLTWPVVDTHLKVCNILDTPQKSSFDHIQLYENRYFSLNLNARPKLNNASSNANSDDVFLPHILSDVLANNLGGQGSTDKYPRDININDGTNINRHMDYVYSHTVHYQSTGKRFVPVDVCRRLLSRSHLQQLLLSYGNCEEVDTVCLRDRDEMRFLLSHTSSTPHNDSSDANLKLRSFNNFMLSQIISTRVKKMCRNVLEGKVEIEKYV